jgi:hypothetical protein
MVRFLEQCLDTSLWNPDIFRGYTNRRLSGRYK